MSLESPTATPREGRVNTTLIDNVDVVLQSYLGEAAMTVGELHALRPGGVVSLSAGLNDLVELRLNGATIARGELVAVGDKFGVRITEISP